MILSPLVFSLPHAYSCPGMLVVQNEDVEPAASCAGA